MDYFMILQGTGIMIVILLVVGSIFYWFFKGFKNVFPNAKYFFKYTIFRRKHKQEEVEFLIGMIERNFDEAELLKYILLSNKMSYEKAKEMVYIFTQLKKIENKMKGGLKKVKNE